MHRISCTRSYTLFSICLVLKARLCQLELYDVMQQCLKWHDTMPVATCDSPCNRSAIDSTYHLYCLCTGIGVESFCGPFCTSRNVIPWMSGPVTGVHQY